MDQAKDAWMRTVALGLEKRNREKADLGNRIDRTWWLDVDYHSAGTG